MEASLLAEDVGVSVYLHRERQWLVQTSVRTVPGFFRVWGPVIRLDAPTASDEELGAAVRQAFDQAPNARIPSDEEPAETPWSAVGEGYRKFCRGTALVSVSREDLQVTITPEENRMFIKPDPGFYARPDLVATVSQDAPDAAMGSAIRAAASALPVPL